MPVGARMGYYTTADMAKELGVPHRTVRWWCKRHNIGEMAARVRIIPTENIEEVKAFFMATRKKEGSNEAK